jgi:hypothetical protein
MSMEVKSRMILNYQVRKFYFNLFKIFYKIFILEKYFPINNTFTKDFNQIMYKNFSLNTAQSRSKVHANLDSVV